jgi:hypothetical protein
MNISVENRVPIQLTPKAKELRHSFLTYRDQLPTKQSSRLGIVIPARKAAHFMKVNLPFLRNQIQECVNEGKVLGADIVVVLNRGGIESDRVFADNYFDQNIDKLILWEKSGHLYKDKDFMNETDISFTKSDGSRIIFIIQEDVDKNTGHTNALRTGFNAFIEASKKNGQVHKYYLTTDTDNRIYAGYRESNYFGNGLLALMNQIETGDYFAVGAKVEPAVTDADGSFNLSKKVASLIRATANLHTNAKGFHWSPGGGTLAKGVDALAAHAAVTNENMEVPDVSFTVLSSGILNKKIHVSNTITVLDDAPNEETVNLKQLKDLKKVVHGWAKSSQPLQELIARSDVPSSWKKLIRWMQGQRFAEDFFGRDLMNYIAQPRLTDIVLGNLRATLKKYGYGKDTIMEIVSLVKELPSYLIIKNAIKKRELIVQSVNW